MNCWGIRIYFTKSRLSLNGGYIVYMELLSGHEKIITKSGISLNLGTLDRGFTVCHIVSQNTPLFRAPAMRTYVSYSDLKLNFWVLRS
jgi:hypothetical protein